ncbi:bromo domain [Teratosphaeria destructans]|uniref:Bromo domain n=1 Tax=Teratosphaeria destructans TaxID=418781 RepID=A0A9W7SKP1_9PEZI|nr:bromo domain [Teratosphaeria destructans]
MTPGPRQPLTNGFHRTPNGIPGSARRSASTSTMRDGPSASGLGATSAQDDEERDDDPLQLELKQKYARIEESIAALFGGDAILGRRASTRPGPSQDAFADTDVVESAKTPAPPKKAARQIDDDYGDDEDEEEEEAVEKESPLKAKGKAALPNGLLPHAVRSPAPSKTGVVRTSTNSSSDQAKSSEDARKQLDEDKTAAAEAAKRSFQAMFYTLENDRDAMLEQQKIDELDREVENEISGGSGAVASGQQPTSESVAAAVEHGTLGSSDLGASSLTLKHLIARIDAKRDMVKASDNQLRTLISEVRRGRSKWASEDKVGQEELYEAADKVLLELKAMTEYVQPFLTRVSKREAQDYFTIIKNPMDIGTMIKKLRQFSYRSKKEFVDDLHLIWSNCLKYNADPAHPYRKKALHMRKETDKLTPLIPDIVVRDRAEVEAEERRHHSLDADESDDDDAPIMASRGRKAPKKGGKGAPSSARKAPSVNVDDTTGTPDRDVKPAMHTSTSNLRNEFLRAESEAHDASSAGFSTSPPGTITPKMNGVVSHEAPASQADLMEVDSLGQAAVSAQVDPAEDDPDYKTWKQVTKKDRAAAAAERHRLFRGDHLNPDEPALLRSKAAMRRWMRQQKMLSGAAASDIDTAEGAEQEQAQGQGETLAEGIEGDEDSTLPDYYNPLSAIPDLPHHWRWATDSEGHIVPPSEEWMRIYPRGRYKSSESHITKKMEANMRQMQETRKVCSKIGLVKQMQLQGQTYQNQFQKYDPQPFAEQDIGPVVVSEDGPLAAPWVNRAALQRSIGKIFYHTGFEDFQPSALDTMTELAHEFMGKLVEGFKHYREQPRRDAKTLGFTFEEQALHALHSSGMDIEALESYVKDDIERVSSKLSVMHERMKAHLADLLRPALSEHAGADGVGAFQDGSEQFVQGDFADEFGEDFFGFKELGLAAELGLESLSVPLHLLQNRMHSAYQAQHQGPVVSSGLTFEPPPQYEALSTDVLPQQIGLVQDFFRSKLRTNHDESLVEDEDLPQKQRFPKPRLPPTGKISSPRKRPIREQQQAAKKKRKLEESEEKARLERPIGKLKLQMPEPQDIGVDPEKDAEANGAMISPESIAGN